MVVPNIFYFHPYWGKWSKFDIFSDGWLNHQLGTCWFVKAGFIILPTQAMHCYKGFVSFDSPKSGNLMIPWKDQEDYPTHTTSWLSLHHQETFSSSPQHFSNAKVVLDARKMGLYVLWFKKLLFFFWQGFTVLLIYAWIGMCSKLRLHPASVSKPSQNPAPWSTSKFLLGGSFQLVSG